jgi:SAM-dependent methyltransferase
VSRPLSPAAPHDPARRTDWDRYYQKPFAAARFTRRFTENTLVRLIRRYAAPEAGNFDLIEFGGANSCFFDRLAGHFAPRQYHVVDLNEFGLERMSERLGERTDVFYHHQDVLDLHLDIAADLVLSVGLIEHFDESGTRAAVDAHFAALKPGGIAIITFPTPTFLYRISRRAAEAARAWNFPDERPLRLREVAAAVEPHGKLLHHEIIWPIMLTQMVIVARKRS